MAQMMITSAPASTLPQVTRLWLEEMRARRGGADASAACREGEGADQPDGSGEDGQVGGKGDDGIGGAFETLSLLEPHKRYQNSVSIFQKRPDGWGEPIHTAYP